MSAGYLRKKDDGTYGANKTTAAGSSTGKNVTTAISGNTLADQNTYKTVRGADTSLSDTEMYKQDSQIGKSLLDSINNGTLKDNQYASYFKDGYGWNPDGSFWYNDGTGVTNLNDDGSLRAKYDTKGTYVSGDKAYDNRQPYVSYADSPNVSAAEQYLSNGLQTKTSLTDSVLDILNQYSTREKFSYDPTADTLFQQNLANSMSAGQMAMQNTMGQAAALTGGYGSTYATGAANQAYNSMIEDAYNNIGDYYNMALAQYKMEDDRLLNQYSMLSEQDIQEYNRNKDKYLQNYQEQRDQVDDSHWQQQYDFAGEQFEYQKQRDLVDDEKWQREFDESVNRWAQEFAETQKQNEIHNEQWQKEFDESVRQFKKNFKQRVKEGKVSADQWEREFEESIRQFNESMKYKNTSSSSKSSSGSSSGSATNNSKKTEEEKTEKSQYTATQLASVKKQALQAYDEGGEAGLEDFMANTDALKTMTEDDMAAVNSYVRQYGIYDNYIADYLSMFDKRDNGYYFNGKPISIFQVYDEFNTYMTKNNVPNDVRDKARKLLSKTLKGE